MHWPELDGVAFIEAHPAGACIISPAECGLHGLCSQVHLKNLNDVKHKLARDVTPGATLTLA